MRPRAVPGAVLTSEKTAICSEVRLLPGPLRSTSRKPCSLKGLRLRPTQGRAPAISPPTAIPPASEERDAADEQHEADGHEQDERHPALVASEPREPEVEPTDHALADDGVREHWGPDEYRCEG